MRQIAVISLWQYVQYGFIYRIGQYALIFFSPSVSFKFINRQNRRKFGFRIRNNIKDSDYGCNGQIDLPCNTCKRPLISKLVDNISRKTIGHSVISGEKSVLFKETFTAMRTSISSLTQNDMHRFSKCRYILYGLNPVIVNCISCGTATNTIMLLPFKLSIDN